MRAMKRTMKKTLSLLLVVIMLLTTLPAVSAATTLPFKDVKEGTWYYANVEYVYEKGLMVGVSTDKFAPNSTLTRAMLVTVLWRMSGAPAAGDSNFRDVPKGSWFSTAVAWAEENQIVMGYNGETFGPNDKITREQMAAMFYRYAGFVSADTTATTELAKFTDASETSTWAQTSMKWAVAVGLIQGVAADKLSPRGNATRAQVAAILQRFCETVGIMKSVTFYMNDGTETVYQKTLAVYDETIPEPVDPTREGYTFTGWYEDPRCSELYDFELLLWEDLKLYAGWKAPGPYTVTFDSAGGSTVPAQTIREDQLIVEPESPERDGFVFLGWFDEWDVYFDFDEVVNRDITLTAEWITVGDSEFSADDLPEIKTEELLESENGIIIAAEGSGNAQGFSRISVSQIQTGPMCSIPGFLAGTAIEAVGDPVVDAVVSFRFDPDKLASAGLRPSDLGIVWYDEENDIVVLLDGSTVDTENNLISNHTGHFSKYAIVDLIQWLLSQKTQLPTIRTEDVPYYSIVLAMDCSGSMDWDNKMDESKAAAKNMIDVLADNDRVTLIAFTESAKAVFDQVQLVTVDETGYKTDNRAWIKSQIDNLKADGGTEIGSALERALQSKCEDPQYQSFVILLSDGQSPVSDSVLSDLKENGQRVVSVGVGDDVDQFLMQHIADATDGMYLYCETANDLASAFLDLQDAYIGSTVDTDNDGLPDLVEMTGMRDQYGEIYQTDPNNPDSDGDGFTDGQEMGTYHALAAYPYFQRISRPDLYTKKSDEAYLLVPDTMMCAVDINDHTIKLELYITDSGYRMVPDLLTPIEADGIAKEYIYSPPENLSVTLNNLPDGVQISKCETVAETSSGTGTKTYRTTAILSYSKDVLLEKVTWTVTADNFSEWSAYAENSVFAKYVVKTQSIPETKIDANIDQWEILLAQYSQKLCKKLFDNAENTITTQRDDALRMIKQNITPHEDAGGATFDVLNPNTKPADPNKLPTEVYEAFALGIYQALDGSKLIKYETNMSKLVNQVSAQIKAGVKSFNNTVTVDGTSYSVSGQIIASSGKGVSWAYVKWNDGSGSHNIPITWENASTDTRGYIASYCAALAELNKGVWKDFLAYYTSDLAAAVGLPVSADTVSRVLDRTEKVIRALCSKEDADKLIAEMGEKAEEQLKDFLKNKFKSFVEDNIPYGKEIQKAAKKYQGARAQLDKYKQLKTADSLEQFKALYSELTKLMGEIQ